VDTTVQNLSARAPASLLALLPARLPPLNFRLGVAPAALQEHVRALAAVTSNTKRHGAPFRHMLFYGTRRCPYSRCCLKL
jgi:hypothetical protein